MGLPGGFIGVSSISPVSSLSGFIAVRRKTAVYAVFFEAMACPAQERVLHGVSPFLVRTVMFDLNPRPLPPKCDKGWKHSVQP